MGPDLFGASAMPAPAHDGLALSARSMLARSASISTGLTRCSSKPLRRDGSRSHTRSNAARLDAASRLSSTASTRRARWRGGGSGRRSAKTQPWPGPLLSACSELPCVLGTRLADEG